MLKLGSSVDWQDALYVLTGSRELSAQPLINYFQPLNDWLAENNIDEICLPGTYQTSIEDDTTFVMIIFLCLLCFIIIICVCGYYAYNNPEIDHINLIHCGPC